MQNLCLLMWNPNSLAWRTCDQLYSLQCQILIDLIWTRRKGLHFRQLWISPRQYPFEQTEPVESS